MTAVKFNLVSFDHLWYYLDHRSRSVIRNGNARMAISSKTRLSSCRSRGITKNQNVFQIWPNCSLFLTKWPSSESVGNLKMPYNPYIDTMQIQFGVCQKRKSYTLEVLLTFYYYNKTLKPILAWQTPNGMCTLSIRTKIEFSDFLLIFDWTSNLSTYANIASIW